MRTSLGLCVEYALFASGIFLAAGLFVSLFPFRIIDRTFGLRLREHFVELIARVSPG